jgi:hypothetical protein
MTAFIAYQPQANATRSRTFSKSPALGSSSWLSSRQSSESQQQATSVSNPDFVDFVDLTASHQDAAREYLVAREVLEPMGHDSDKRGIRVAINRNTNATDNDKIDHGEKGDNDDDDIGYESDTSDLPSLQDVFAWNDKGVERSDDLNFKAFISPATIDGTIKERCREGGSEDIANPAATAVRGVQLGASQGECRRSHGAWSIREQCMLTYYPRKPDYAR